MGMDWEILKREYVNGTETYGQIAQRHGVGLAALTRRAREEGWVEARREAREAARNAARERKPQAPEELRARCGGEAGGSSGPGGTGGRPCADGGADPSRAGDAASGGADIACAGSPGTDGKRLASLRRAASSLADRLERAMEDPYLLHRHTGTRDREAAEFVFEAVNGQNMQYVAKALREAAAAVRDLYGITTLMEETELEHAAAKLQLEREKLELERIKADVGARDKLVEVVLSAQAQEWAG